MAITHRKPETHGPLAWLRGMYASTHAALPVRKQNNVAQSVVVDRALSEPVQQQKLVKSTAPQDAKPKRRPAIAAAPWQVLVAQ